MKLKDIVTLGNLLCGFAAVIAIIHGHFDWACYLIYIAYVFDVLDGPVARLTKQYDTFGAHFDSACDFVTNSVAASFIVYYAFEHIAGYPTWLAAIIAAFPIGFGTGRQAQQADKPLSYPCYWLGLPRPVATLFIVPMLHSPLFNHADPIVAQIFHPIAAVLIAALSYLHLSTLAYPNHKSRRWMYLVRVGVWSFLGGVPVAALVAWLVLDNLAWVSVYVLLCLFGYIFFSWTQIPREDLRRIRHYLDTGEVIDPLVHRDGTWRPSRAFPYFEAVGEPTSHPTPHILG